MSKQKQINHIECKKEDFLNNFYFMHASLYSYHFTFAGNFWALKNLNNYIFRNTGFV